MFLLFLIISLGTFVSLLAAEYSVTGREGTAHFLLTTSTQAASLLIVGSAFVGLYLALSIVLWLLGLIF